MRPQWALQYMGMDWHVISEFMPPGKDGVPTLDDDMRKFAAEVQDAPAQCACGRPLECPECISLRTEPQTAQEPPLAKMLKEVNPELAKVLTDNAAYVQAIRNNVIDECAKDLERGTPGYVSCEPQFSNGYYQGREDALKEIRALSRPLRLCSCKASERDGQHMEWCRSLSSQEGK